MSHTITADWSTGQVVTITFSDQERHNQVSWAAIDELGLLLKDCREQGARVVILASGLPGHWLEHAWLTDLSNGVNGLPQTGTGAGWFDVISEVEHPDVVSIAAISGDCSGGGAEIGWACDLRVAETQARFAQPEVNMGLTTGIGGCSRLSRLAGRATATEMVLTGRPMSAGRLYDLGAVTRVVANSESLRVAQDMAADLAKKSAVAVRGLKRILAISDSEPLDSALVREQEIFQSIVVSDDGKAGMAAAQKQYDQGQSVAQFNHYNNWREK